MAVLAFRILALDLCFDLEWVFVLLEGVILEGESASECWGGDDAEDFDLGMVCSRKLVQKVVR